MTHKDVIAVLQQRIAELGTPKYLRCDNGAKLTAHPCCKAWQHADHTCAHQTRITVEKGKCESYNSILRDELLNMELFLSVEEAQYKLDEWRILYNHFRPQNPFEFFASSILKISAARVLQRQALPSGG